MSPRCRTIHHEPAANSTRAERHRRAELRPDRRAGHAERAGSGVVQRGPAQGPVGIDSVSSRDNGVLVQKFSRSQSLKQNPAQIYGCLLSNRPYPVQWIQSALPASSHDLGGFNQLQ